MNEYIADLLAQHFIDLPFISKTGGCIQVLLKDNKGKKNTKLPVVKRIFTKTEEGALVCNDASDFFEMAPNSNNLGILYFEDMGANVVEKNRRYQSWKGSLKLVCWLNMKRIGTENDLANLIFATISGSPKTLPGTPGFVGGSLSVTKQFPKSPHPFQQFNYDEVQTQFITYPYEYFSLQLDYKVRAVIGFNCSIKVDIKPELC